MSQLGAIAALRVEKDSRSLRTRTADVLRNAILQLHFKPGQRLIERELCEQTGVSRTSVREALRQLESEGLIVTVTNRGPTVAEVTVEELYRIDEVREALEGLICRLFTERASNADIDALGRTVGQLEKAIGARDLSAAQKAKEAFLDTLYDGANNEVARAISRSLRARVNYLSALATARWDKKAGRATIDRRRKIVAAIKRRDAAAAEKALIEHLRSAREISAAILQQRDINVDDLVLAL